jgi:hypothetical protein
LRLRLLPPGAERPISIEAWVRLTRNCGAAGCEYLHIPPIDPGILGDWLKSKTQVKKPFVVVWHNADSSVNSAHLRVQNSGPVRGPE